MRYILKIVRAVEKLYAALDEDTDQFKQISGIHCIQGCSACCTKPDIEASVLEMIPLAWYLYSNSLQDRVMERIKTCGDLCSSYMLMDPGNLAGRCTFYNKRALICRLFGNSAITLKDGHLGIYTCHKLKVGEALSLRLTNEGINKGWPVPLARKYRTQLDAIDIGLAADINPINESLCKAMEKVSFHFRTRPERSGLLRTGS